MGHACEEYVWTLGPAQKDLPRLRIAQFAPGPKTDLWVYATIGAWEAHANPRLEFVLTAPKRDPRHIELMTVSAWYHGRHGLGAGHTFKIGQPWLPGSACESFLVSFPHPFGSQFEVCQFPDWPVQILWLLPITPAERQFKIREGLEALEQRFDQCRLEYWAPGRASAV